jgi:hypothetical protein
MRRGLCAIVARAGHGLGGLGRLLLRFGVEALASGALLPSELERRGASGVASATYQLVHCLTDRDLVCA